MGAPILLDDLLALTFVRSETTAAPEVVPEVQAEFGQSCNMC